MSIKTVPLTAPAMCLTPGANLRDTLKLMLDNHINHLPLCDDQGGFAGLISTRAILMALIPASARVEHGLSDLRFAGDSEHMLVARLRDLEQVTVEELANNDIPVLDEDCPILEAALLLTHHTAPLPVVGKDGRLRGMLSRRVLLAYLAERAEIQHA